MNSKSIVDMSGNTNTNTKTNTPRRPPNAIYFPAVTLDYYLKNDETTGIGLVARRNIRKGKLVFSDCIEFMFADVVEGDYLLLQGHQKASKLSGTNVPSTLPVTRETLLETHGVPTIIEKDPTGKTADDSDDPLRGEGRASRNIKKGEELTCSYTLQFYEESHADDCMCGSSNCRGLIWGFENLSDADKDKFFSKASEAVKAMYLADIGKGPPVMDEREEIISIPVQSTSEEKGTRNGPKPKRLVFPGPSCAFADVEVKRDDEGGWYLCASKDFAFGQRVYEFWRNDWPFGGVGAIDMVASTKLSDGDLPEGTVIRFHPSQCAAKKDRSGHYKFSGWDLLIAHACVPNITYCDLHDDEDDDWQAAYATRNIKAGEKLTIDFNSVFWDRSDSPAADECHCGSAKCVGMKKGFKFLPKKEQYERKLMTWRRVSPPYDGEKDTEYLGMALTPHVREHWRADEDLVEDCPDTAPSSSSSSSSDDDDDDSSSNDEEEN